MTELPTIATSDLEIPGVGPNRRRALLKEFGSVQGVRDAGLDAIAAVPGFSAHMARKVLVGLGVELQAAVNAIASQRDGGDERDIIAAQPAAENAAVDQTPDLSAAQHTSHEIESE